MEVSFAFLLDRNTHFLKQVSPDRSSYKHTSFAEVQLDVFTKSRGVVIPDRPSVSEGLKYRI
jgi:hypothetical protein